jgi:hypothetical protein
LARTDDVQLHRQILANLLHANAGALPEPTRQMAEDGLAALRFGDTPSLFRASSKRRHMSYAEARLKLAAVSFVEYRAGHGVKRNVALQQVGTAFGASPETVNGWGRLLNDDFGPLEVARHRGRAFNAGRTKIHEAQLRLKGAASDPSAELWDEKEYGDDALQKAGQQYRVLGYARKNQQTD